MGYFFCLLSPLPLLAPRFFGSISSLAHGHLCGAEYRITIIMLPMQRNTTAASRLGRLISAVTAITTASSVFTGSRLTKHVLVPSARRGLVLSSRHGGGLVTGSAARPVLEHCRSLVVRDSVSHARPWLLNGAGRRTLLTSSWAVGPSEVCIGFFITCARW